MNIAAHQEWFENHVKGKISVCARDIEPLEIKLHHTGRVLDNAMRIVAEEGFSPALRRAALLAALYHDLSRFDQYLVYGTFKDKESRNHGSWSVKLLRQHARLERESPATRRLVYIAVGLHNRLALPAALSPEEALVCNAVRDADKIDVVRVMDAKLATRPYNPTVVLGLSDSELAGPGVLAAAHANRPASYGDLRSVNDFRLLLGTWLFGLNFEASRNMFIANGHAARIVADLPQNEIYGDLRARFIDLLRPS